MATTRIQSEPFDLAAEFAALTGGRADIGGTGCFIGSVRGGDGLVSMTLEHYPGMTDRAVAALAEQAESRWALLGCTVIHRVGCLLAGEPIVLVLVASHHRQAALEATRYLIDRLKTDAPFWKVETFANGTRQWVEPAA
jgi:molybdopterin synthase catalytic subunit